MSPSLASAIHLHVWFPRAHNLVPGFPSSASRVGTDVQSGRVCEVLYQGKGLGVVDTDRIAAALKRNRVTSIDLCSNSLGNPGASCLAACLESHTLTTLNLGHNDIGDPLSLPALAWCPSSVWLL